MAKYLDYAGLQYLWAKIKNYVSTQPLGANVRYDQQTLTTAQQAQARANIAAGGSNRNLLDNPFFTVNQRMVSGSLPNNAYGLDRWKYLSAGSSTFPTLNTDGTITFTLGGFYFYQPCETALFDYLTGKTVTYSAIIDGEIYSATFTFPSTGATNFSLGTQSLFARVNTTSKEISFHNYGGSGTINLSALKLELGSVSTLANDAPPDYAEELAKCQYYCRVIETSGYFAFGIAAGSAHIQTPLQYAMRARPSVSFTGSIALFGANDLTASSIVVSAWGPSAICLDFVTTGATSRTPYIVNMTNAQIILSADL